MQLNTIDASCRGPISTSHWIIPDLLLSSGYPGSKDPEEHRNLTRSMYDSGVEVFVSLMQPTDLARFIPYEPQIREYAAEDDREIKFISFPIPDQFVCRDDEKVLDFCLNLSKRIKDDHQKVLIHCWGGHGRTSTIMSILIGILFHLEADDAMEHNFQSQQQRLRIKGRTSPMHPHQRQQVRKVLEMYKDRQTSLIKQQKLN